MASPVQHKSIGFHVSPEINITFIESSPDKIEADIRGVEGLVSVNLPEVRPPASSADFSTVGKVTRLLRNCHLQPSYSVPKGQKTGEVSFMPVEPENKTWEKYDEIELPEKDSPCFFRSDGTLSYAFVNTVTTWDWKSQSFATTSFKTSCITALAELPDGRLLVGDEKGNLFLEGNPQPFDCGNKDSITEIIAITKVCYFIKFKNEATIIFDIRTSKVFTQLGPCSDFIILKNRIFGFLQNNKLRLFRIDDVKNTYEEINHVFKDKNILGINAVSDSTLLLVTQAEQTEKPSIITWNLEKNLQNEHKNSQLRQAALNKKLFFLDEKTFACTKNNITAIAFYSVEKQEFTTAKAAGKWGVSTLIPLSDGSIMYATHTTPSGIHVVTKKGEVAFTNTDLTQNRDVESMTELVDGAVAIKFPTTMMIIYPRKKQAESFAYKIDRCLLELRYNPSQLDLYEKLAKLYEQEPEKRYQTYLAGLESAIKGSQLYLGRRYYEKARKIKPDTEEPSRLFMSYLENSAWSKQKKQVALDLYRIQAKSNSSAQLLKPLNQDKKCKERLFIGEGGFSFTEALIEKHQQSHSKLAASITATELVGLVNTSKEKGTEGNTQERVSRLHHKDVTVLFGIDGQQLHQIFKGKRFKRIHWNCPFGNRDDAARRAFKDVIPQFFLSCSHLQLSKDRIHISLMQEKPDYWKTRQRENPIVEGATLAGYRLIRKRDFGNARYPKYVHVKTTSNKEYPYEGEMREFVFEKADMPVYLKEADLQKRAQELRNSTEKKYEVKTDKEKPDNKDYYFECSTDEDSSDYYESDTEPVTP
jgi:hypothetical protein